MASMGRRGIISIRIINTLNTVLLGANTNIHSHNMRLVGAMALVS
jgi:hypothetical protein